MIHGRHKGVDNAENSEPLECAKYATLDLRHYCFVLLPKIIRVPVQHFTDAASSQITLIFLAVIMSIINDIRVTCLTGGRLSLVDEMQQFIKRSEITASAAASGTSADVGIIHRWGWRHVKASQSGLNLLHSLDLCTGRQRRRRPGWNMAMNWTCAGHRATLSLVHRVSRDVHPQRRADDAVSRGGRAGDERRRLVWRTQL